MMAAAPTTRLVRPPRLLGFGGRPYNFYDREALGGSSSSGGSSSGLSGVLPAKFSAALLVEGPALVLADVAGNVALTDGELRVALQHKLLDRAAAGSRVLLARSRQSPPLMVLCGVEAALAAAGAGTTGGPPAAAATVVVKTWVGSKLSAPSNVIDVSALLKAATAAAGAAGAAGAAAPASGGPAGAGASKPQQPSSSALVAASLEPTALACNFDGTKIVVGFRSGALGLCFLFFCSTRPAFPPTTTTQT